jgi:hypothetical protein
MPELLPKNNMLRDCSLVLSSKSKSAMMTHFDTGKPLYCSNTFTPFGTVSSKNESFNPVFVLTFLNSISITFE